MANLPPSLSMKSIALSSGASSSSSSSSVEQLILNLTNPELRESALHELSKKRDIFQDLAPILWHSVGIVTVLLQEITSVYHLLSPPTMTPSQSNRVCNALALLQVDDTEVIRFLLQTEIVPLCLRTMENGSELSKTVATFIVQRVLQDDIGLEYMCTTAERFTALARVLGKMVTSLAEGPSPRLLKHIVISV